MRGGRRGWAGGTEVKAWRGAAPSRAPAARLLPSCVSSPLAALASSRQPAPVSTCSEMQCSSVKTDDNRAPLAVLGRGQARHCPQRPWPSTRQIVLSSPGSVTSASGAFDGHQVSCQPVPTGLEPAIGLRRLDPVQFLLTLMLQHARVPSRAATSQQPGGHPPAVPYRLPSTLRSGREPPSLVSSSTPA